MSKEEIEAKRLIELYLPHSYGDDREQDLRIAKACAAICVTEIIKELQFVEITKEKADYWNKVLKYLQNNENN